MDYETTLRRALQCVGNARVNLAMPYDLPQRVCEDLLLQGLVQALVADSVHSARTDTSCAGWWVERARDHLHLRPSICPTLLIAGMDRTRRVGARLLLEARLKGVRRVVTADRDGDLIEDLQVDSALIERIEVPTPASRVTGPTFEEAFEEMYSLVGDRLSLSTRSFVPDRVALYVGSLGPGGAERQCTYTAVGVSRGHWKPFIVCDHFEPPADFFRPYVESEGIPIAPVVESPAELADPRIAAICQLFGEKYSSINFDNVFIEIVRYASVLRALRPRLIHCWMDYCNTLAGSAAALVGVPCIVLSCRSLAPDHFRIFQPFMRPAYQALLKRRRATILNNSWAGANDYARWLGLPENRIQVVHNGFNFPESVSLQARAVVRQSYGIPESARVVGSILRFSEEKRPRLLIDTARELYAVDSSVRFLFFGGGAMLQEMRECIAALNLEKVIYLPGYTNALWDVLAAMDIFLLTSRMEGLPNVLVEAQASGLPVVAPRVGGTCETFIENETGLSVEGDTPTDFASAVRNILNDDALRRRMSGRALEHARKAFGLQPMVESTQRVYAEAQLHHTQMARAA